MNDEANKLTHPRDAGATHLAPALEHLAEKAKELKLAAADLEQLSLLGDEPEFDEALLLERPQMEATKRYTAAQVDQNEIKRNYILDMLGFGVPINVVARRTHTNTRTVIALGAKYSQVVANNSVQFAQILKAKAASFLFHAESKAADAKFGELMVGVGIATQRAQELEASAAGSTLDTALEAEQEDEQLKKFREGLKQLKPATSVAATVEEVK